MSNRNPKSSENCRKLCERLIALGLLLPQGRGGYYIQRCNPGRHGRAAGAWSWSLQSVSIDAGGGDESRHPGIGSTAKISEILAAKSIVVALHYHGNGGYEIDPSDKDADELYGRWGILKSTKERRTET